PLVGLLRWRQTPDVATAWGLEEPQFELGEDGDEMVEHIGLHSLVDGPAHVVDEHVKLERQPARAWLQLPDEERHVLRDSRVRAPVARNVRAERADVR